MTNEYISVLSFKNVSLGLNYILQSKKTSHRLYSAHSQTAVLQKRSGYYNGENRTLTQ